MSNLIPEVRNDKNGNPVVRWISSMSKKRTSADIPAPIVEPEIKSDSNWEPEVAKLCELLQPTMHYDKSSYLATSIISIAEHAPELFRDINQAVRNNPDEIDYWEDKLQFNTSLAYGPPKGREQELNECRIAIIINPLMRDITKISDIDLGSKFTYLFQRAVKIIMDDSGITSVPQDLTKAVALITCIEGQKSGTWTMDYDRIPAYSSIAADAEYIANHCAQVMELLPELCARGTHDWRTIDRLINSDTQVLREGEL